MSTRIRRFRGGPLDGQERPAPLRGRTAIYLDDEGTSIPPAKANPRRRGYYRHVASRDSEEYVHSTVPRFTPLDPKRAEPGETGWSMLIDDPSMSSRISEPVWDEQEQRWSARVLVEEKRDNGEWRWAPIGREVHPTAV